MKKTIITITSFIVVFLLVYVLGIGYYADKFQANTHLGAIDVSQLTLSEAKDQIQSLTEDLTLELNEQDKTLGVIQIGDLNPEIQVDKLLEDIYNHQNPNEWFLDYFKTNQYDIELNQYISIDERALMNQVEQLGINNEDRLESLNATLKYTKGQGYSIEPETIGNQIDLVELKHLIIESIESGQMEVDVSQAYYLPTLTREDEYLTNLLAEIEQYEKAEIQLEIQDEIVTIGKAEISDWIYFDEQNQLVINDESVMDFLKTLNDRYATFDKARQFTSTLSGQVTVQPGTLGWSIDRESETEQIIADIKNGEKVTREPVIVGTGYQVENDIGETYVEVDIDHQMMFVYIDGVERISTPIVTGRVGTDTVPGAYSIWDKEANAELVGFNEHTGRDYVQPVEFWLPFDDTGQGIHDANWQGAFGGDAYLTAGSLGCINTPPDAMREVFELVPVGTPVIVF